MISCSTDSVEQTRAVGGAVASLTELGDVIVLVGDLGAGKTAFVQGFAAASGVTAAVTSPTFTLANRYEGQIHAGQIHEGRIHEGQIVVNHLDVYRFESLAEVDDLALPELLEQGVTLIEWGDMIASVLPADRLTVTISLGSGENERSLELLGDGELWLRRAEGLTAAVRPWVVRDC